MRTSHPLASRQLMSLCPLVSAALAVAFPSLAVAQSASWTGGGSGTQWSDSANWTGTPPTPVPGSFGALTFDTNTVLTSTVDGQYAGGVIEFGPSAVYLMNGFLINTLNPGDNLTIQSLLRHGTEATHEFAVDLFFDNPGGFVNIDNGGYLFGLTNAFVFSGTAEVTAGTTLGIDNNGHWGNFLHDFLEGLDGGGSLQVGTQPFVQHTTVNLHGDSDFSGDLRFRNNVNVLQTATGHAKLTSVQRIFFESPADFAINRATLSIGEVAPTATPLLTVTDALHDFAELNFYGGALRLSYPGGNYGGIGHLELTGTAFFNFGHSLVEVTGMTPVDSFDFRLEEVVRASAGATTLMRISVTDAVPITQDAFLGGGSISVLSGPLPDLIGGGGLPSSTSRSIVPWIAGSHNGEDALTFVSFLTSGTYLGYFDDLEDFEYTSSIATSGSHDNVSVDTETLVFSPTGYHINALRVRGNTPAAPASVNLGGSDLHIGSGAILFTEGPGRTIQNGTIQFGTQSGVVFNSNDGGKIAAPIAGSGGLVISGNAALTLAADNVYTGKTYVNTFLNITANGAFGQAGSGNETHVNQDVLLTFTGGVTSIPEDFFVEGTNVVFRAQDAGIDLNGWIDVQPQVPGEFAAIYFETGHGIDSGASMTINGDITTEWVTHYVFDAQGEASSYGGTIIRVNGQISDPSSSGSVSLFKYGHGDLILANDNTVSGLAFADEGRMIATGQSTAGSATGTAPVTVVANYFRGSDPLPALGGNGRFAGNVFLEGAAVDPFDPTSPGTATLRFGGNMSFAIADFGIVGQHVNELLLSLVGTDGGGPLANDVLEFDKVGTPSLALNNAVTLRLDVVNDVLVGDEFGIVIATSGTLNRTGHLLDPDSLLPLFDMDTFSVNTPFGVRSFQVDYRTDSIWLITVPEPSSVALFAMGASGALFFVRRRRAAR